MQGLEDTANWIANNVFGQVPILIGLITLAGLLVQRRPVEAVVSGALRAMIGIVILLVGTDLLSGGLAGLQTIISSAAGLDPPASSNTMDAFLVTHGNTVALVITIGFVLHLLLVRLFPEAGFLYLSGHLMFWTSLVITATLVAVFGDRSQATLVICGSVIIACYWTLQPLWMRPLMRKAGAGDYGLASTTSVTALLTGWLARPLGDPARHDTERLRPPRPLAFLADVNVAGALVVGGTLLVAMAFADKGVLAEQARSYNDTIDPWVWGVITALRFAGGIAILLYGVRMFLAEIIPAFRGVGDRLLPGTEPAVDLPAVFPRAPLALIVGFAAGTATFLVLMGVFAAAGWFTLVPPMIMLFFAAGAGGVFGNAVAGWRGAALGGALNGAVLAFGQWATWHLLSGTAPELATLADPDWYALGWLLAGAGGIVQNIWLPPAIAAAGTVAALAVTSRRAARAERAGLR